MKWSLPEDGRYGRPKEWVQPVADKFVAAAESGVLARRVEQARRHLEDCDLCPRYCRVNRRLSVKAAVCRTGERAVVHSYGAHHGEEDPLRGWRGSGTIFFSWCNLRCVYCQNWEISQKGIGEEVSPERLAAIMIELQEQGEPLLDAFQDHFNSFLIRFQVRRKPAFITDSCTKPLVL